MEFIENHRKKTMEILKMIEKQWDSLRIIEQNKSKSLKIIETPHSMISNGSSMISNDSHECLADFQ